MKFNEEAFEGTIDIVAAAMEEAEVELSAEGGKKVAEFFEAIYKRLAVIANEEGEEEDDDDGDEEEEDDSEEEDESDGSEPGGEELVDSGEETESVEDAAQETIASARTGSFEIYADAQGKYRFRLKASNGQTIAVSQAYKKKESCLKGLESVKKHAGVAVVKEV